MTVLDIQVNTGSVSNARVSHGSDSVRSQWGELRSEGTHKSFYVPAALPFPALEGTTRAAIDAVGRTLLQHAPS
jgi:hypothetical protein